MGTGGGISLDTRMLGSRPSRDLLRLLKSLAKFFTEMRWSALALTPPVLPFLMLAAAEPIEPGVSSLPRASDMNESSEKRLEG